MVVSVLVLMRGGCDRIFGGKWGLGGDRKLGNTLILRSCERSLFCDGGPW